MSRRMLDIVSDSGYIHILIFYSVPLSFQHRQGAHPCTGLLECALCSGAQQVFTLFRQSVGHLNIYRRQQGRQRQNCTRHCGKHQLTRDSFAFSGLRTGMDFCFVDSASYSTPPLVIFTSALIGIFWKTRYKIQRFGNIIISASAKKRKVFMMQVPSNFRSKTNPINCAKPSCFTCL